MSARLGVRRPGPQALVEDLGRPGHAGIGVGLSGAADRAALRQANRALANEEGAAAVEAALGGLEVEVAGGEVWFCVTGAPCPVSVDGDDVGPYAVHRAGPGAIVRLGTPATGLRSYLAVRGGLDVAPVLGSRSRDVLAGLGPEPLREGDVLPVGRAPSTFPIVDQLPGLVVPEELVLLARRGPRDGWVRDIDDLVRTTWTSSQRTNRVGMRLDGGRLLHRQGQGQLPSEGAWRGAVQVPPSGEPVVLGPDRPVTGGYPVVAVLLDSETDRAAQVRPGQQVRFRWA